MSESEKPSRRVELDPNPPRYKTPVPSLPSPPRVPSDIETLLRHDIKERDTDRSAPLSGEFQVSEDAEKTPHEAPYSLKKFADKIDEAISASRDAANNSLTMMQRLDEFARELKALAQRVTALEISRQWAPLLLASVALVLVVWLAFKVQDLQQQVLMLQRITGH